MPDDYESLTREELISILREQDKNKQPPNDWHSWMDTLLHIMLHRYYPDTDA